MNNKLYLATTASILLTVTCQADELAGKARDIFKKNQHAVVTVQEVLKVTASGGGRSSNPQEYKQDLTGTVIDPSGLTVMALSAVDPAELARRVSEDYKVETQVNDMKMLLDDGTEVPSEIVLRDKDLDLAFIRPKVKPTTPMDYIDLTKSSAVEILEPVVALNRLNRAAGRAYSASIERMDAVIQKPRTFYIPDSGQTMTTRGCPAFALDGNIVGIFVVRAIAGGDGGGRSGDNVTSIVIPAEDVLKGSKQAPEAKGDADKPAEAKEQK